VKLLSDYHNPLQSIVLFFSVFDVYMPLTGVINLGLRFLHIHVTLYMTILLHEYCSMLGVIFSAEETSLQLYSSKLFIYNEYSVFLLYYRLSSS